jgi:hypothetical protein
MGKMAHLWVGFNAQATQGSVGSEEGATVKRDNLPSKKDKIEKGTGDVIVCA